MRAVFYVAVLSGASLMTVLGSVSAYCQDGSAAQSMRDFEKTERQQDETLRQQNENQQQMAQQNSDPAMGITAQPKFSVKQGKIQPGTMVHVTCPTHYAVIYYTTNGWSPTTSSRRYTGPIPITATTTLQAIAQAPKMTQSSITQASYKVNGPATPVLPLVLAADGVLHAKTRLHLATNSTVSSKTAEVGDKLDIVLDQDVKVGDAVVIAKGTAVDATIAIADPAGTVGEPGDIAFEVHSLAVRGIQIPIKGGESLEGISHQKRAFITAAALTVTFVGAVAAVMMTHGGQAEIKPGMKFTGAVVADTPLLALNPDRR